MLDPMRRCGALFLILVACGGDDAGGSPGGGDGGNPPGDGSNPPGDGGNPPGDGAPVDVPGGVGEPPEMEGMTLLHNQVRAMVDTSTPLPPLTWNNDLAATAAAWIATCTNVDGSPNILDHNDNRSAGHPYYVGENIYASSGGATPQGAVQLWAAEKANYTYPDGYSAQTGHYTQLVWRTTLEVGCAVGNCPNIQYGNTIVCNYGPGGNTGGAPY
jgi:pathogenesis-related protein 1